MKIVFDEKAGYEFFALNDMAKIDDNAKKLLKRLSVILADMMQKPGINDSNFPVQNRRKALCDKG